MIVERVDVENFRNVAATRLELAEGLNLLVGPNGAGKTALLEALHVLIRGRSFRTSRTAALVRDGQERMAIGASARDPRAGVVRLYFTRHAGGRAVLRRDGEPVRHASDVAALLPVQALLPNLSELVFGSPAGRRQWLDWGAFHWKARHATTLRAYLRALRHRNAVLRSNDYETLDSWTEQVALLGEAVADARESYFRRVEPAVVECLGALAADFAVTFGCAKGWQGERLADALRDERQQDLRAGATRSGPHRADVTIRHGGQDAAATLSRGQGKMVASALRLGQAQDLMAEGRRSLFLIDDVGAELDSDHSQRFYRLLDRMNCQIVATSAQSATGDSLPAGLLRRMFHVKQGAATQA